MRSLLIILSCAFLVTSCKEKKSTTTVSTAEDKAAITQVMNDYAASFQHSDWDKLLSYIHPGAFDFVSKTDFRKALEASFKGEGYTMKVESMSIDSIENPITIKDDKYAKVHMRMSADMELASPPDSSVCAAMRSDTDVQYVDCRTEGNHVYFSLKDKLYAVYLAKDKKWYILSTGDADSKKMVEKLIPEEARK